MKLSARLPYCITSAAVLAQVQVTSVNSQPPGRNAIQSLVAPKMSISTPSTSLHLPMQIPLSYDDCHDASYNIIKPEHSSYVDCILIYNPNLNPTIRQPEHILRLPTAGRHMAGAAHGRHRTPQWRRQRRRVAVAAIDCKSISLDAPALFMNVKCQQPHLAGAG